MYKPNTSTEVPETCGTCKDLCYGMQVDSPRSVTGQCLGEDGENSRELPGKVGTAKERYQYTESPPDWCPIRVRLRLLDEIIRRVDA